MDKLKLWYREPASEWTDALPIGNGRIGAMVWGGTAEEIISLNEDTLWSGYPQDKNNYGALTNLEKARELSKAKKYGELSQLIEGHMLGDYTESYLPLGALNISFPNIDENIITDYYRELDLNSAKTLTRFRHGDAVFTREAFVSHVDNALIMKFAGSHEKSVDIIISFASELKFEAKALDNSIHISGLCPSHVEPNYLFSENPVVYEEDPAKKGMRFNAIIGVDAKGGVTKAVDDKLMIKNASEVTLKFAVRTSFNGFDKQPFLEGKDSEKEVKADMERLGNKNYAEMLKAHLEDYHSLFDRVDFHLESKCMDDLATDERLERFSMNKSDLGLYVLLFQYGRYLMISSSRPGTQPSNLQGIWNAELRAPWSSNYTLNINTEMNYWMAEVCNLSECHEPLFDLIDELAVNGALTARVHYGAGGVVAHHNTDIWRMTNPVGRTDKGSVGYAYWCMSFGWLTRHLFEHYEYTLDEEFLRNRAYPMIKKAAEFFMDILIEDENGSLIVSPSTSPENAYIKDGKEVKISKTATMSTAIVRETLKNAISCCEILMIDNDFCGQCMQKLDKLPDYQIGKKGNLMEWDEDYEDAEENHRHISHLYPLYPGTEISVKKTPELAKACEQALNIRGDGGTGWSLGWKVNAWARLKDGNHALRLLQNQLNFVKTNVCDYSNGGGTYRNLFDAHPPFQIDGNFAASAGIAEMLLQYEDGKEVILPALPDDWKSGYIKGLRTKGGKIVDINF